MIFARTLTGIGVALPAFLGPIDSSTRPLHRGAEASVSDGSWALSASSPSSMMGDGGKDEDEADLKRRMSLVRSLQETFYSSPPPPHDKERGQPSGATIIGDGGLIEDLPLWRVPWTELPGRSNVLHVHEGTYTHMFETVLRSGSRPWYVGHLYLPGGSEALRRPEGKLESWKDRAEGVVEDKAKEEEDDDDDDGDNEENDGDSDGDGSSSILEGGGESISGGTKSESSAVVGTLLRVADHRRMSDGRLLLLVQALERFVVDDVKRELPYSVADVRLVPDVEEVQFQWSRRRRNEHELEDGGFDGYDPEDVFLAGEGRAGPSRAAAVAESQVWWEYEYDDEVRLPVRDDGTDVSMADIAGSELAGVMPLIPYSSTVDPALIESLLAQRNDGRNDLPSTEGGAGEKGTRMGEDEEVGEEREALEKRLVDGGILLGRPDLTRTADELEVALWIAIDEFVRIRRTSVPPNLLAMLPVGRQWPPSFALERLASAAATSCTGGDDDESSNVHRLSEAYPAHRRQKRLSYAALSLIEGTPFGRGVRQTVLRIPTTRGRLWAVLERFEVNNVSIMGEFL